MITCSSCWSALECVLRSSVAGRPIPLFTGSCRFWTIFFIRRFRSQDADRTTQPADPL